MVQIIQGDRRPSQGQRLNEGIQNTLGMIDQFRNEMMQKDKDAKSSAYASKILGEDVSGVNPDILKLVLGEKLKGNESASKFARESEHEGNLQDRRYGYEQLLEDKKGKYRFEEANAKATGKQNEANSKANRERQVKAGSLQNALQVVNQMRQIRSKNNLGIGSSWSPFSETQRDSGEYSQLGKSLIPLAANIPVRNQKEFETYAHDLIDPTITDARAEGILSGIERIINDSLQEFSQGQGMGSQEKPSLDHGPGMRVIKENRNRPPLSSFQR